MKKTAFILLSILAISMVLMTIAPALAKATASNTVSVTIKYPNGKPYYGTFVLVDETAMNVRYSSTAYIEASTGHNGKVTIDISGRDWQVGDQIIVWSDLEGAFSWSSAVELNSQLCATINAVVT